LSDLAIDEELYSFCIWDNLC